MKKIFGRYRRKKKEPEFKIVENDLEICFICNRSCPKNTISKIPIIDIFTKEQLTTFAGEKRFVKLCKSCSDWANKNNIKHYYSTQIVL